MKPEPTFEQLERRRFIRRRTIFILAVLLVASGYAVLAIPPETPMDTAIPRGFIGISLLIAGLFLALLSRAMP
ncbi:MAG: hypothetical protein Q8R88_02175 [Desulfoprunum sp.]|nr:hypothetical protein [Desulfoprunum sp.]